MLTRWGSFVYARRRLVLVLSGASLVLAIALMTIVSPSLISTGWVSGDAESSRVEQSLVDDFDRGDESIIFLFDSTEPVADPATRSAIETAIAPLFDDSRVARVLTPWNGGNENFISENGQSAYAVAILNV
jgi:trehalose monomycolate/heme transporter